MARSWLDQHLLSAAQKMAPVPIRFSRHEGSETSNSPLPMKAGIRVKDRQTLIALMRNPMVNFGELYSAGDIEVEGDLVRLLEELYKYRPSAFRRRLARLSRLLPSNSLGQSRQNIHHHYDLGNDFYQLWLDSQLVYTCAYFPEPDANLEEAQQAKMDLVGRKLWLKAGETVVEAGCGWGSLALYMAKNFGVRVRAFNISREQVSFAREQARRQGLDSMVEFCEDDYRNISGKYDAFVSVGMLEHVGRVHYNELARVIHRAIGASGRGLLHFIGRNFPQPLNPWIRKRIFPGGYAPALRETMKMFETYDFSVLDVENLRAHYARTLEFWLARFERCYDQVADRFGQNFARMWRLYLAGSTVAFRTGVLQLFQIVFAGRSCVSQPWNREYLYQNAAEHTLQGAEWTRAMS